MDKALKQRLVGASVIIALAVIVLPMLLSGRPEDSAPDFQKIELPPRPDELAFETRRFPINGQEKEIPTTGVETAPAPDQQRPSALAGQINRGTGPAADVTAADVQGAEQASPAAVSRTPETDQSGAGANPDPAGASAQQPPAPSGQPQEVPQGKPPVVAATSESASNGRYLVQVASLGSSGNAGKLMASLQQRGFPVLMDVVDSDVGKLNRVRVGPYANEAEAAQASARISKEIAGVNPRVVDLQPEQSALVTRPSDPLVRWVVQVGSFSDESNAIRLVKQLQDNGNSAYRESVTSGGSLIYRVRVGPFIEREEALRTRDQLSQRMAIDGVVMSAD